MNKIYVTTGAIATETKSVKKYMADIKKPKLLTREQEADATRDQLVESNLRFVVQVAKQYQGMGVAFEDLVAFGNIGLFEAVERFNLDKNVKFITFAVWYIRSEINKALNDLGRTVRVPSHRTQTEKQYIKSIHAPVGEDDDSESYADRYLVSPFEPSARDNNDMQYDLKRAISQLKPKQAAALTMFYGIGIEYPRCMEQIAEELQVTGERARQLVRQAEKEIRKVPGVKLLEQYL